MKILANAVRMKILTPDEVQYKMKMLTNAVYKNRHSRTAYGYCTKLPGNILIVFYGFFVGFVKTLFVQKLLEKRKFNYINQN